MKALLRLVSVFPILAAFTACHTLNKNQTTVVKRFASTAKDVSDMPYQIVYNYYTIKFKVEQLFPEHYTTRRKTKEALDSLPEKVISAMEEMKDEYMEDLKTADIIKTSYEVLQVYISSLEKLASDKYPGDFEKKSAEAGTRINELVKRMNDYPQTRTNLPLNPGQWLSSLATVYGRNKLKTMQATLLKEYINQADTLVQAINYNYQETQVPILNAWLDEEAQRLRLQFKRSIGPYVRNISRYPDSASSIVNIEFYTKINPVYYELSDEISKNQLLVEKTKKLMQKLADTHRSLKAQFAAGNNWANIGEEVDALKEQVFVLRDLFNKAGQEKFTFYKTFIMQNEKSIKNILDQQ